MTEQKKWFKKLKNILHSMPQGIEVMVSSEGVVLMSDEGGFSRSFQEAGMDAMWKNPKSIAEFKVNKLIGHSPSC